MCPCIHPKFSLSISLSLLACVVQEKGHQSAALPCPALPPHTGTDPHSTHPHIPSLLHIFTNLSHLISIQGKRKKRKNILTYTNLYKHNVDGSYIVLWTRNELLLSIILELEVRCMG